MPKVKLTINSIKAARPQASDYMLWDSDLTGFGCKVAPTGRKTFVYYYRTASGQQRKPKIGTFGSIQPEAARTIAKAWSGEVARGLDPSEKRKAGRQISTVAQLADKYLTDHARIRKAEQSIKQDERLILKRIAPALGAKKIDAVGRADIIRLQHSLKSKPFEANRVLALLSNMFNLAQNWELMAQGTNPVKGIKRYKEPARERFLGQSEYKKLWQTLDEEEPKAIFARSAFTVIRLLILTGRRVGEMKALRWKFIDFERGTMNLPDTKTGAVSIPLSQGVLDYLSQLKTASASEFVCPGKKCDAPIVNVNKAWRFVRSQAGLEDVRLHDLRHSYASAAVGLGASLPLIGNLLGHTQAATTERYAHVAQDPARVMVNAIGIEIAGWTAQPD